MLKNRLEREMENAKRQLAIYEGQLKEVETKTNELELKNQQYTSDLAVINKQVQEKEKEVEDISQKIRDIRLEHGSSDARQVKILELKVRKKLSEFFQNCKKHKIQNKNVDSNAKASKNRNINKGNLSKGNNNLEEILEVGSQNDFNNLSSDRKFLNGGSRQENGLKASKISKEQQQNQENNFSFVIKVINGQQVNDVPIDLSHIQKVANLRDYLAKTYSIQKEFLFLYDESGNMLLDEMNLETSLFPNVFKTIKNYVPTLKIEVKRQQSKKNKGENKDVMETLMTGNEDAMNEDIQMNAGQHKKVSKKSNNRWNNFIKKMPNYLKSLQHLLENLAILALIVLFIINRYIGNDVINKYNINEELRKKINIILKDNENPFSIQSSTKTMFDILKTSADQNQDEIQFTSPMPSIVLQERMKVNTNCYVPPNHAKMYNFGGQQSQTNVQGCVDFDSTTQQTYGLLTDPFKYQNLKGTDLSGFILKIPDALRGLDPPPYDNLIKNREGIVNTSNDYLHLDEFINEEFIINMLTAINTLLLMLSFTKYLASWSFILKIYSQIMTQFVKNSWSLLFVVLSILLIISFSWMTFIDGSIQNHDSFIYSIFAQIKATFYSSFLQDLRINEEAEQKPEMTPVIKKAVFNPFVITVMMIIQLVIHFSIFSFLASLMAHSIHQTKERMEKISKEIKDFEKRKVVSSTIYFRKSMQNMYNQDNNKN